MNILITDTIAEEGITLLQNQNFNVDLKTDLTEEQLVKIIAGYDALIIRSKTKVSATIIQQATKLKVIGRAGSGVDNIDLKAATRKGIFVLNTPGANANSVAELTLGMMLALLRNIPKADASLKHNQWLKKQLKGQELSGQTIGIIGFGSIGKKVAELLSPFHVTILVFDPHVSQQHAKQYAINLVELETLLHEADIITIHVPLLASTKNLLSDHQFNLMKSTTLLINASRGGIVDEHALIKALATKKIAGAACDVFNKEPLEADYPLLQFDNVIVTPHIGAATVQAQQRASIEIAQAILDALTKHQYHSLVNQELIQSRKVQ